MLTQNCIWIQKPKLRHFNSDLDQFLLHLCPILNTILMAKVRGAVLVDVERCKGCNLCVVACPSKVLSLNNEANSKGYNYSYMINDEDCVGCAACAYVCPDACITVFKKKL